MSIVAACLGVVFLCAALTAPIASATELEPQGNDGLRPGEEIPAWAIGRKVHFLPSPARTTLGLGETPELNAVEPNVGEGTPPLIYHKGSANETATVHLIFWGSNWTKEGVGDETRAEISQMFAYLRKPNAGTQAYQGILSEYWGQHNHIRSYEFLAAPETIIDESVGAAPTNVNEEAMVHELNKLTETHHFAKSGSEQFIVLPAPGSTYAAGFVKNFCGFHEANSGWIYSFVPYAGDTPFAEKHCPELDTLHHNAVNATNVVTSHEYAEAVTDPVPYEGWSTSDKKEVGDLCADTSFELGTMASPPYVVIAQELYDNYQGRCSQGENAPPETIAYTGTPSNITQTEATLNATVWPGGTDTTYHTEYGTTTQYGTSIPVPDADAGSGLGDTLVKQLVTGLKPQTTYDERIVATSRVGTFYGENVTFKTGPKAPFLTASEPSKVTETEATLNWFVNPESADTKWHFEYGATNSYGTVSPSPEGDAGSGNETVLESTTIKGLKLGTLYHYQFVATNSVGKSTTGDLTFRTKAVAPIATTEAASGVAGVEATVNASVNPEGTETSYKFEYGPTNTYGTSIPIPSAKIGSGTSAIKVHQTITGLKELTTYHFRISATNVGGTTNGADMILKTLVRPVVETQPGTEVTKTGARLNGSVNPEGADTKYHFEYGTTLAYGTSIPVPSADVGSGRSAVKVNQTIAGLTEKALYHFRISATNSGGTVYGADQQFTPPYPSPLVTTGVPTNVHAKEATVNGTVNPEGNDTKYIFEYGTTLAYGTTVPIPSEDIGAGTSAIPVKQVLKNLAANTTYHYRVVATSKTGTSEGKDEVFTTAPYWARMTTVNAESKETELSGVSCTSSSACTAVGHYRSSTGKFLPVVERWNGSTWALQAVPIPAGTVEAGLGGVSCVSSSSCSASGSYRVFRSGTEETIVAPLAEHWNGTEWSVQAVPQPTESGAEGGELTGISCTSTTECTAVGSYTNNIAFIALPLVERWNGTVWSVQSAPSGSTGEGAILRSVSCLSSTFCTASGQEDTTNGGGNPLAEHWNGSEWAIQSTPIPLGREAYKFFGVSCGSATACTAVGRYYNESFIWEPMVEGWNGSSWALQSTPATKGEWTTLGGVSCVSSTACTASGNNEPTKGTLVQMIQSWNGSEWTIQSTTPPPESKHALFASVSCVSATSCVAVGWDTTSAGSTVTLAEKIAES